MIGNGEELSLDELRRIVGVLAARYGMKRVYLFGSRARHDNTANSDYDFCVLPGDRCGILTLGGFITDLKDELGTDVDLVYEDCLPDDLMEAVRKDGILLYATPCQKTRRAFSSRRFLSCPHFGQNASPGGILA